MNTFAQTLNSESLTGAGENRAHYVEQRNCINDSLAGDNGISNSQNIWIWFLISRLRSPDSKSKSFHCHSPRLTSFMGSDSTGKPHTLGMQWPTLPEIEAMLTALGRDQTKCSSQASLPPSHGSPGPLCGFRSPLVHRVPLQTPEGMENQRLGCINICSGREKKVTEWTDPNTPIS